MDDYEFAVAVLALSDSGACGLGVGRVGLGQSHSKSSETVTRTCSRLSLPITAKRSPVSFQREGSSLVDGMADQCPLCERPRESPSEFCSLHNAAMRNLESAFSSWNKAYEGRISKEECFDKIKVLPETGQSVKDVIYCIRGKGAAN